MSDGQAGGTRTSEFSYDGLDRRVRVIEKQNGVEQSNQVYIWDGTEIVQRRDSTGVAVARNYFDQGFEEDTSDYFYTKDHLGSIREVVASDGTTVEAVYDYSPWGEVTKTGGTGVESDFLYTGHYHHSPSDLHLTLYRAYDSELGMWLSRDPIAENGGINLYAYVLNDPINWWDADGQVPIAIPVIIGGKATLDAIAGSAVITGGAIWGIGEAFDWLNRLFSEKAGECPTEEDIKGKSAEEIDEMMQDKGWTKEPSSRGGGTRYKNPNKSGEQVRIQPGNKIASDPSKHGPYGRISKDGKTSTPIPLDGNKFCK